MLKAILRVIFWAYRRGSWQYDILCALILAFIFLTPRGLFDGSIFGNSKPPVTTQNEEQHSRATHVLTRPSNAASRHPDDQVPGGVLVSEHQ